MRSDTREEISAEPKVEFVMLTQYAANIPAPSAFAPGSLENVLGDCRRRRRMVFMTSAPTAPVN